MSRALKAGICQFLKRGIGDRQDRGDRNIVGNLENTPPSQKSRVLKAGTYKVFKRVIGDSGDGVRNSLGFVSPPPFSFFCGIGRIAPADMFYDCRRAHRVAQHADSKTSVSSQ